MKKREPTPVIPISILEPGQTIFEQGKRYSHAFLIIEGLVRLTTTNERTSLVTLVGALTDGDIIIPQLKPSATRTERTEPFPFRAVTEQTTQGRLVPLPTIYRMFMQPKTPGDRDMLRAAVKTSWDLCTKAHRTTIVGEIVSGEDARDERGVTEQIRLLSDSDDYAMVAVVEHGRKPPAQPRRRTSSYGRLI